jgi:DNA-directed RNA polymerase specialized sigma subunit
MSEIKLNKFEKEKRVIELYKEGKTIREIAQEVHMAFRDISQIIKKYIEDTDENKNYKRKYQFKLYLFLIKERNL